MAEALILEAKNYMEDILNAIKRDIESKNYYAVLFLTVMLPSICSALESANGRNGEEKYIRWYNNNISDLFLKGDECYKLRCALLHQGRTIHEDSSFNGFRFTFLSRQISLHNNNFGGALNLDIVLFAEKMLQAVDSWSTKMKEDGNYKRNIKSIIRSHRDGFKGFISGIDIISIY